MKKLNTQVERLVKGIPSKIAGLRASTGLNQERFGTSIGYKHQSYGQVERGTNAIGLSNLIKTALVYNVNLHELLTNAEFKPSPQVGKLLTQGKYTSFLDAKLLETLQQQIGQLNALVNHQENTLSKQSQLIDQQATELMQLRQQLSVSDIDNNSN